MTTELSQNPQIQAIIAQLLSGDMKLSYSALSSFKSSPADFIRYKLGQKEQTDAMIYGSLLHCLVLEPEKFDERYHALDDRDICLQIGGKKPRATTAYKEWKMVAESEAKGRIIVGTDDIQAAGIGATNVKNNVASAKVLYMCPEREKKVEWNYMNFNFHGFIDLDGDKARADLKTCADATPRKFWREIIERGYYLQAAMYNAADNSNKPYYIIAVDQKGGVSVHLIPERLMEIGQQLYAKLLDSFNECILTDGFHHSFNWWAPRHDGIFVADIPGYLYS